MLTLGVLLVQSRAAATENYPVDHISTVADAQTIGHPGTVYGDNTLNAGKITVDKSVSDSAVTLNYGNTSQTFTPGDNGFIVTVSQTAQMMGMVSESQVPLDVVFILDTSGSMNRYGVNRSASMVMDMERNCSATSTAARVPMRFAAVKYPVITLVRHNTGRNKAKSRNASIDRGLPIHSAAMLGANP